MDIALSEVLAGGLITSAYQPIVEIDTGLTVGYEALARGPAGTSFAAPDQLFAAARTQGRLAALDAACRTAAFDGAAAAALRPPWTLFVNCEPESIDSADFSLPRTSHPVVLELTERELTRRPAELLNTVRRVREAGWGLALDDVGADPASLALLALLRPDVIKLDLRLIQQQPSEQIAAVVNAVLAEAERTGAHVLAEGIETEQHLQTARAFGATLGQGWYFARPGALRLPEASRAPKHGLLQTGPLGSALVGAGATGPTSSPFDIAALRHRPRSAVKSLLIETSKHLERQAVASGESTVCLSAFQHHRHFTADTRRRYDDLQRAACFVGALGEGMPARPMPGVRGAHLGPDDPVRGEWDIAVLGPHFAACLVARDLGDSGPEAQRRFEFVISHDRELVTRVALSLMSRMADAHVPLGIASPRAASD